MVLLKNDGKLLPLKKDQKIAVIGEMAAAPRYQGSGSSQINPTKLDNACDCLREMGYHFQYAQGYEKSAKQAKDAKLFMQAVETAREADTVLLFIGLTEQYESEGFDRKDIQLPPVHNELLAAILNVNPNVVVVLSGGSPVALPWLERVPAVLNAYLGGQAGAGAVADILSGAVNPSGKLAESYPMKLSDTPARQNFPGNPLSVEYRESIFIGYRYYDKMQTALRFPFGYGLSYTQFAYSALTIDKTEMTDDETLTVRFDITNTGEVAGAEIAQLYVADVESAIFRAPKELRGFVKVFLAPGETKTMTLTLEKRAFAYYNVELGDWHVESGAFELLVGASAQDIRLRGAVTVKSTAPEVVVPDYRAALPQYYDGDPAEITALQFEKLLGRPLPPTHKNPNDPITLDDTLETASHTKWGGRIVKGLDKLTRNMPEGEMIGTTARQARFRMLIAMSGGLFSEEMAAGLLRVLNGQKPGKGFYEMLRGMPNLIKNIKKQLMG